jgi:hypothetical protein
MKKLGEKLRDIDAAFVDVPDGTYTPTKADLDAVNAVWRAAKKHITYLIEEEVPSPIGLSLDAETDTVEEQDCFERASAALARSCLPHNIPVGIECPENPFHQGWRAFCRWALSEELFPELMLERDERYERTALHICVTAFPVGS